MGVSSCFVILVSGWALDTITRKGERDKANSRHVGLEPCARDRHCHLVTINLQRPERFR
jgi:hypothetical protein